MNMKLKYSRRIASALLLSVVLAGCASGTNAPSPELQQRIEAARTRSDHEGLVTYYNQEAASARAKAAEHRKMAKSYQGMAVSSKGSGGMQSHCNAIVSSYLSIAAEYDGLASSHRQMAEQASP